MKVFVTGGCGFMGTHVCEYYSERGEEVIAFDNMTKHELARTGYDVEAARKYVLDFLGGLGVTVVKADIRDQDALSDAAQDCDYIIHTAAQPAMTISMEDPELDLTTNVIGTYNVLEEARKNDVPVVYCSTIHVYGNKINEELEEGDTRYLRDPPAIDENHSIMEGTLTPLHVSKRSAELYVQTFIDTYGLGAAIFRLTGLYGPRQFGGEDHGWVANFTIRTLLGKQIRIFGTGKQIRDILYATDAVQAFEAFYKTRKPGTYNIGGGTEHAISLLECISLIEEVTSEKAKVVHERGRHGDLLYFVCDIDKAERLLAWTPKIKPRMGLEKLAAWVLENIHIFQKK